MRVVRLPVFEWLVARLPLWAVAVVAVLCVAGGVVLTLSPFTSVEALVLLAGLNAVATGVLLLVSHDEATPGHPVLLGVGWLILGVVILAWPGLSVAALAIVIGVALVATGLVDVARAVAGRQQSERTAAFIGGLASIVFGALALSWPDVTVFVVAVLFGARTVLFGVSQLISVITRWRHPAGDAAPAPAPAPRGRFRRCLRLATRSVALVLALGLLAVSTAVHQQAGAVSAFYDTPSTVPAMPGALLRSESYTTAVPRDAQAWPILYSTKSSLGKPAVGSAIVLAPRDRPSGPRPVILWTHGTVGITRPCAPSVSASSLMEQAPRLSPKIRTKQHRKS